MNCPNCKTLMRTINYEGVMIETCDSCNGEWLDKKEIMNITQAREKTFSPQQEAVASGGNLRVVPGSVQKTQAPLLCTRCLVAMKTFNYAYDTGVMVDKCPVCEGIWLDNGELEHVQVTIEAWEKKDPQIRERFLPILNRIQKQSDINKEQARPKNLIKALLYNII